MIRVEVKNVAGVKRYLSQVRADIRDKALQAGINKTGAKAKTEMVRAISSEYVIKQSDIRARLRLQRAARGNLTAVLDPFASRRRGRSLNLIRFVEGRVTLAEGRRRRQAGTLNQLRFQIKRGGGRKTVPGAFIGNRGRTVFRRIGTARLPIEPISTIDVPSMFNTRRIAARVRARIERELLIEVDRAVQHILKAR